MFCFVMATKNIVCMFKLVCNMFLFSFFAPSHQTGYKKTSDHSVAPVAPEDKVLDKNRSSDFCTQLQKHVPFRPSFFFGGGS